MSLALVGERALWLNLSSLSDREKAGFLDAPVELKKLFGPAVNAMHQKCELLKKEGLQLLPWEIRCTIGKRHICAPRTLPFVQRPIPMCLLLRKTEGTHFNIY